MAKLVLEVNLRETLSENDLIVFDEKKQIWQVIPKALFLAGVRKEVKELKEEVKSLKAQCNEAVESVKAMARIIKEGLE